MKLKRIFDAAKAEPLLLDLLPNAENGGKICPHHDCDGGRELLGCFKCKSASPRRNGKASTFTCIIARRSALRKACGGKEQAL